MDCSPSDVRLFPGQRDCADDSRSIKRGLENYPVKSCACERCTKNPDHQRFIPVNDFQQGHLPSGFRNDPRWAEMLKARAADTVKVRVSYTSPRRPEPIKTRDNSGAHAVRQGSGTAFWTRILSSRTKCPFPNCRAGDGESHDVYGPFRVVTVAHLVYDESEARDTTIEFFDDDPIDRSSVRLAQVTGFIPEPYESNRSILICVTHDPKIPELLEKAWQRRNELLQQLDEPDGARMCVLISHPHGMSKRVSVGEPLDVEEQGPVKETQDCQMKLRDCRLSYSTPSCAGSGGGSVTLWQKGRRAFAPHCKTIGEDQNQSALGWVSVGAKTID